MVQKCIKVQAKHGEVTQNMHGASRNYRDVWDVSHVVEECLILGFVVGGVAEVDLENVF